MTIRFARPDEAGRLTEIAHAAKRHWGYPEEWIRRWSDELTIHPDYILRHPTFVAEIAERPAAFVSVMLQGEAAVLDHLWTEPAAMARGIGRELFARAEQAARDGGATRLTTTADPHATGFYHRMGMIMVGQVAAPIDGRERHLPLMEKSLAS